MDKSLLYLSTRVKSSSSPMGPKAKRTRMTCLYDLLGSEYVPYNLTEGRSLLGAAASLR